MFVDVADRDDIFLPSPGEMFLGAVTGGDQRDIELVAWCVRPKKPESGRNEDGGPKGAR